MNTTTQLTSLNLNAFPFVLRRPCMMTVVAKHVDLFLEFANQNTWFKCLLLLFAYMLWQVQFNAQNNDEVQENEEEVEEDESEEESASENDSEEEGAEESTSEIDLLRFDTTDVKYDQAANILAYLYSKGLTLVDVEFPIHSRTNTDKIVQIKYSSFLQKVKKYRKNPSESMRLLINRKPSIDQLVEAYTYYAGLTAAAGSNAEAADGSNAEADSTNEQD